ncbi:MAG: RNA pseudouridine synthase [Rhizobiales bacterium 65-9]|nr:RNA pseudouridine synthase [Hyphomicrobiales bacterium]OJY36551.1 MAG: RNA pseudouridine synthase [Rhizobiales bacterium 65-9]
MTPEELITRLLHRDASVLVLDKPAGLPVHPGPKGGETLTDHLDALRFGLKWRPELAHRLDRDTSGCIALGRHPRALRDLNALFRTGKAKKLYWAVVAGGPAADEGLIDLPLARKSPERGWWMKPDAQGLPSQTRFRVLGRGAGADGRKLTWLELEPLTGRTHQLRVHCAASGYPILGDAIYGHAARGADLHLHARSLELPMNPKKPPIVCEAPAPEHIRGALERCGCRR